MTCKAASFGGFSHKRLKADPGLVDGAFEVKRGRHKHLSLLMCGGGGAKHKPCAPRPAPVPEVCSSFAQIGGSTPLNQVLVDSGLKPLRCGQGRKYGGAKPTASGVVENHDRPAPLCVTSVTPLTLSVAPGGPASGFTQREVGNGRKRLGAEDRDILESWKRRKQECDLVQRDDVTCPKLSQLQPVVCNSDQTIPLNDVAREIDIELDAADVVSRRPSFEDGDSTAPFGALDVSFKSGASPSGPPFTLSTSPASPPLGTPFEDDSDTPETRLEKKMRYREGLQRGMNEFLNQTLPLCSPHGYQVPGAVDAPNQGCGQLGKDSKRRKANGRSGDQLVPRGPAVQMTDESQLMLEAAQGFVLMLDDHHRILYVSENVHQHLGHEQINVLGQNILDYIHPKDVSDFLSNVRDVAIDPGICWNQTRKRMFCVGMKFCFQKAGSRHKDAGYTFVQWNAKLQLKKTGQHAQVQHLVALCRPVRTDSILELRMDGNMFISRHDLSFHFIYCDPRIINLIGYEPCDLIGRTAYQFHCPRDVLICKQCHKLLILSGSSKSDYYRFLSRSGKWVWLCTHATIVYDTAKKPQYVVCKNFVISEQEARQKLAEEFKDFADMKCLGFSLETDLPAIDSVSTSGNSLAYHVDQDDDGEALVNQLLSTQPVDVSDNPYARPRKKRSSTKVSSSMGVSVPSSSAKYTASDNNRLQTEILLSQDTYASSELCSTKPASSMETVSSFDQLFITQPQADDVFTLTSSDDFSISFSDMLETAMVHESGRAPEVSETISPAGDLGGHGSSMSEVSQHTTNLTNISTSPELDLTGSFTGYKQLETDFLDLMDCTPSITTPPNPLDNDLSSVYIKTTTNTISRYPTGNISVLPNILPAKTTVVKLTHPLNDSVKPHVSVASQNTSNSSSRLFSLLKNNNLGDCLTPSPNVTTFNSTGAPQPAKANVTILKNVFLSQEKFPGTQHFIVMKSAGPSFSEPLNSVRSSASTLKGIFNGPSLKMTESACPDQTTGDGMFSISDDVSSVLTNGNSDPFLCQLTESTLYTDPYMMEEDLCPKDLSGMIPLTPSTEDPVSEKQDSRSPSSISIANNSFSPAGMKDLDTFFSIISPSSESIMSLGDNLDSQTIPFTEQLDFSCDQDQSLTKNSPVSLTSNESSSDSDTPGRPSLLRTLLDKEGEAIQGPLTYKEWVKEEALRKKSELKKARISLASPKHAPNLRLRNNKPGKSTELPLPKSHFGNRFSYSRDSILQRKPTKELPLPLSAQRQKSLDSSQVSGNMNQFDSELSLSSNDMNLPDDLLDLAVEYCAMGPEQEEALLTDLNENSSFEDNLYSLIASPAPSRTSSTNTSGSKQISVLGSALSSVLSGNSNLFSSKICPISPSSSYPASPSSPPANKSENLNGSPFKNVSSNLNITPTISKLDGIGYHSSHISSPESGKMSLLRAAVTSPDVDKLIEQIPFGNRISFNPSPPETKSLSEDPDIVITKVNGLQKMSAEDNCPESTLFKVPSLNSTTKSSGKTSPSKPFQIPNSPLNSSDHIDAILFDHLYTTSLAMNSSSPPRSPTVVVNASCRAPGSVLSPRVHTEASGHKTIRGLQNKHKSNPTSPRPGCGNPNSPRAAGITNSDLSSTHPISVMIMKKDNHRSRRSRSIGLQTDNEPGEVYPEFERSSTDTILYPSGSRLSSSSSPTHSDTSGTASLSSSPTMSELEKFLRGFSSQDENSHSTDEDNRSKRGTPFLQKLLTGELTKDNYQRIDQQLLDRERRESISSGSDYELT